MSLLCYFNNFRPGFKLLSEACKPICLTRHSSSIVSLIAHSSTISKHCQAFTPIATSLIQSRFYCQEHSEEKSNKIIDASKDRSKKIPVEVSIKYMQSSAYKTTYGEDPVWKHYRRNHKGQRPPRKTRKRCIRQDMISTGNPCPICRDEYLVLHPDNVELVKQFISPYTGAVLSYTETGLCQRRHQELLVAFMQAQDLGTISFDLPFQKYDYSEYIDLKKVQQ